MMNTHNSFKVFGFTVNFYAATEDEILLKKKALELRFLKLKCICLQEFLRKIQEVS